MIQICSLDLLNKDFFETDIFLANGKKVFSRGDKITPELILKLYFKEIYQPKMPIQETSKPKPVDEENILKAKFNEVKEICEPILAQKEEPVIVIPDKKEPEIKLEFDEDQAQRFSKLAYDFGLHLGLGKDELEDLKKAAYYINIGRKSFTTEDEKKAGFKKKLAQASYEIILSELGLPIYIAETAKFANSKYVSGNFNLKDKIPYHDIVSLVIFYDGLVAKNKSKDEALDTMLQLGANRFNIYVLHKFIRMMKDS